MFKLSLKSTLIFFFACVVAFSVYVGFSLTKSDDAKPQITCDSESVSISVNDDDSVLLQGVSASDKEDGDLTDKIIIENISKFYDTGKFRVTYAVSDSKNNVSKTVRSVEYTDYVSPSFNLTQQLTFTYGYQFDLHKYISATDCIDGDVSSKVKTILVGNASSIYNVGNWTVRAEVTNSMGDTASVNLEVSVKNDDLSIPVINLTKYLVYIENGSDFDANSYISGIIINGQEEKDNNIISQVKVESGVDTSVDGQYNVKFSYYGDDKTKGSSTQMTVIVGNPTSDTTIAE